MSEQFDAIVIGSGPNGLAAAVALAQQGASVLVLEAHDTPGGGTRTRELTLPGFHHDVCSACHPMGVLSPFFRELPLEQHGLEWVRPQASVAHPLDDGSAVLVYRDLERTAAELGVDADAYRALIAPFLDNPHGLLRDALAPLGPPSHPILMARFGLHGLWSARGLARMLFKDPRTRALLAGCAGHATQPLENPLTAAMTLMFLLTAHVDDWPVVKGGSENLTRALVSLLESLGGQVRCGVTVRSLSELPLSKVVLFDTDPLQLAAVAGDALPERYRRRLRRYRFGPGSFKVDWALDGPIPWRDPRVLEASTVHLGGTLEEIAEAERAAYEGHAHPRPYVLLVQQSQFDASRAPEGKHTGYAYCHVPAGSEVDMTEAIESQVERFAPGFRDLILAKHTTSAPQFAQYNLNFVGGAVTGGTADATQLFTRPVARLDPYSTPNPHLYLCSAATPPGGGVHGMCGYHAAQSALKALPGLFARTW